jgi:DNA-damage-inducible protein D
MENQNLSIFEGVKIRQIEHNGETYFSVIDVIQVLTDSNNPNRYWTDLKRRSEKETGQSYAFCVRLNLPRTSGKPYPTDCANTEGVLRIAMSVPSPKAEPLRLWLAEQGKQALDEANDPELLTEKQIQLYKAKGYTDEWIERRIKTIEIRKELTNEWKNRGVKEGQEYSILTSTIAKGTFGVSPSEHANLKGLEKENLRDHMTTLELLFTALGEELTRDETTKTDAQGFNESFDAAQRGGYLAGKARTAIETETGKTIVSKENFLPKGEEAKGLKEGEKED